MATAAWSSSAKITGRMILAGESQALVNNARTGKAAQLARNGCMILLKPIPGKCSRLVGTDSPSFR